MNENIKISVVMATYNGVDFIEKAIDSVLSQFFKDFELIVVDDGSTDIRIKEKLQPYVEKELIKYFYKKNGGQGSARNLGIKESIGKYIAFIDDDDYWSDDKLEKQYNCINGTDFIGCYTDSFIVNPNNKIEKRGIYKIYEGDISKNIILNNFITLSSSLILKESIVKKSNPITYRKDYALKLWEYSEGLIHKQK